MFQTLKILRKFPSDKKYDKNLLDKNAKKICKYNSCCCCIQDFWAIFIQLITINLCKKNKVANHAVLPNFVKFILNSYWIHIQSGERLKLHLYLKKILTFDM